MSIFDILKGMSKVLGVKGNLQNDKVVDADGNGYTTVKVGNQVWTAENLRTTKFNNATPIPLEITDLKWFDTTSPAYCWYGSRTINKQKYGALYNWHAISTGKLAPKGWHVPTYEEWKELEKYLIMNGYNWDGTKEENKIAKSLAVKTDWKPEMYSENSGSGIVGDDLSKNNSSSFSAVPGGFRYQHGKLEGLHTHAYFWTATETDRMNAHTRRLRFAGVDLFGDPMEKGRGCSVRIVKD